MYLASSSGKWWSAHCVVRAHAGLPAGHHPYWLWWCTRHHLPHEEPHVFYSDHEETTGMSTGHGHMLHFYRLIKCPKRSRILNTAIKIWTWGIYLFYENPYSCMAIFCLDSMACLHCMPYSTQESINAPLPYLRPLLHCRLAALITARLAFIFTVHSTACARTHTHLLLAWT